MGIRPIAYSKRKVCSEDIRSRVQRIDQLIEALSNGTVESENERLPASPRMSRSPTLVVPRTATVDGASHWISADSAPSPSADTFDLDEGDDGDQSTRFVFRVPPWPWEQVHTAHCHDDTNPDQSTAAVVRTLGVKSSNTTLNSDVIVVGNDDFYCSRGTTTALLANGSVAMTRPIDGSPETAAPVLFSSDGNIDGDPTKEIRGGNDFGRSSDDSESSDSGGVGETRSESDAALLAWRQWWTKQRAALTS